MQDEMNLVHEAYNLVVTFMVNYSFQLLGAILILIAGFVVAGWVARLMNGVLQKNEVDQTLRQFIASTARLMVIMLFMIIALGKLGVSISPFIAAIGGLAVGASFALQGPVSNYGAGLMIILTRLYKVGDTISIKDCFGVVSEITLSTTTLVAEDGEMIVIPNKQIAGEIHRNSQSKRIMEGRVGIAYEHAPEHAISVIEEALKGISGVGPQPRPQVGISDFGDSAINIAFRVWLPSEIYYSKLHEVNLCVFKALGKADINIPYPKRDVIVTTVTG